MTLSIVMPPFAPPPPPPTPLSSCLQNIKKMVYKGLVRPILEYASPLWDPHGIVFQKELVQNRAARFVTGNCNFETWDMTSILEHLGWESLLKRRKGNKLILLFKCLKAELVYLVTTFNPKIAAAGISIQWHFKWHMLELTSTVSSQTPLGIGIHSLYL